MDKITPNTDVHNEDEYFADSRMSFGDHLMELRSRIIKSIIGVVAAFIICLILGKYILLFISEPMLIALKLHNLPTKMYFNSPPEYFLTYIKVALISGIFLSAPWTFYQIWGFIAAGLYAHEKRFVNIFAPFSAVLFIIGGFFFVTVVAPISFNFFVTFGSKWMTPDFSDSFLYQRLKGKAAQSPKQPGTKHKVTAPGTGRAVQPGTVSTLPYIRFSVEVIPGPGTVLLVPHIDMPALTSKIAPSASANNKKTGQADKNGKTTGEESKNNPLVEPLITLQKYITFVIWLALVFGLAFQMPLIVFVLGRLGLVSIKTFRSIRRYICLVIFIVAALITPPDVISQIALALPMLALYELGILLLRFWPRKLP